MKPLALEGEHTLETSIAKFVGYGDGIPKADIEDDWLTRTPKDEKMLWCTIARNGYVREYLLDTGSLRCKVLDCILILHRKSPVICNQDIMDRVGWRARAYYAKVGGAPRGPLRGHVAALRKNARHEYCIL